MNGASLLFCAVLCGSLNTAALSPTDLILIYQEPEFDDSLPGLPAKSSILSVAEDALIKSEILPAARQYWKERSVNCDSSGSLGFRIVNTSPVRGSFTKPHASQKAILYTYCVTGHNFANNGVVVFEADHVAAHIAYKGGWGQDMQAVPDIDGNGESKILIVTGGTAQNTSWQVISVIGLTEKGVQNFGHAETYTGDCEGGFGFPPHNHKGQEATYKLFARKGPTPVFYREPFSGDCGEPTKWHKSGRREQISLEDTAQSSGTTWFVKVEYVRLR